MATLKITGVPPLDGNYPLEIGAFTNRELHTIKEISGVRAGELRAAMEAADNDLVVAFAVIVLRRAGRTVDPDQVWDAELGAITVDLTDEAVEQRPPASPLPGGNVSEPAGSVAPDENTPLSGPPSSDGGDPPARLLSLTGPPGSDTGAISDPETLAG